MEGSRYLFQKGFSGFYGVLRGRAGHKTSRASAASDASGAMTRPKPPETTRGRRKLKIKQRASRSVAKTGFYVERLFRIQKRSREVLNITSVPRSILIRVGAVLEPKLPPKLDPSCRQNRRKSEKNGFLEGSELKFSFGWVFVAKKLIVF